jgi:N-acyl-L-homoserine lactone synthetase
MIEHFTRMGAVTAPKLFQSMHADRKRVFVDMMKWDVPHDGVFEKDQYDTERADYLILKDTASGDHKCSLRLLPTTGSHLLSDVFPFLCDGKVPRGPSVREITRFVVSPDTPRRERLAMRNMLCRSLIEYGQMNGIEFYTAVCDIGFLTQILASGWRVDPLGLPQEVSGSLIGAVLIHVEPESLAKTSEAWRHPGPVLRLVESSPAMAA